MKMKSKFIEDFLVIVFILILLPFPKIIEEILLGLLFCVCFFFCFWGFTKIGKRGNRIYAYNLPYLILEAMLLQIHSVRFSLVANNIQNQLLCVHFYQWFTEKLQFTDTINFGVLIYFWFIIYFFSFLFSNGITQKNQKEEENSELVIECRFCLKQLNKYMISCFVISFFHFVCEIIKNMIIEKSNFETAFLSKIVITIGTCFPFVIIYLMMAGFIYRRMKGIQYENIKTNRNRFLEKDN